MPSLSAQRLISRLYPAEVMLNKEGQTSVKDALKVRVGFRAGIYKIVN